MVNIKMNFSETIQITLYGNERQINLLVLTVSGQVVDHINGMSQMNMSMGGHFEDSIGNTFVAGATQKIFMRTISLAEYVIRYVASLMSSVVSNASKNDGQAMRFPQMTSNMIHTDSQSWILHGERLK